MSGWEFTTGHDLRGRSGASMKVRRNRTQVHVHHSFRGGQIIAIDATEAVIKLHLEHSWIGTRTVDLALFHADAGRALGDPVVCEVSGTGASDYVVTAVRKGTFAGAGPRDQVAAVARGEFYPAAMGEAEGFDPIYRD